MRAKGQGQPCCTGDWYAAGALAFLGPRPKRSLSASLPGCVYNFTAHVTAWAHLGRECWSGFGQSRGGPTTGRPYQEVDGTSAAGLAEGTETASRWACQACPGCSLVRGSQEPITGGEGLGPLAEGERGADRGRLVSWPVTPLSRYARRKPLWHPQPGLQTMWLRQADLIPPTREDLRARKTQEQMVIEQQFKDVQQASYRLRAENMETSAWTSWKRFLPPHSQGQRRLSFFYKREICFRHVSLNKDLLGPFSHLGPCGGLRGGGLLK